MKWIARTVLTSRAGKKRAATEYASAGICVNYGTTLVRSALKHNSVMNFGKIVLYKKEYNM